ncbi:hypothetical protein X777_15428 [Ooceraea biroi]|uniref:Integrase catalytic domain-containing protein n=1 Tax=Ooceraea biroi TaxID=2015173 RepID=A0A026VVK7_OOCBI|nr:hypothetical protein X777_15428 [Ooceraea biroi]
MANSTVRSDTSPFSLSHLPTIRLPPFDGKYEEWEHFRDRFTALIRDNPDLSDFARMHYLTSSLKGRALECIANLSVTADNFAIAWHTLKGRFENKRRLVATHPSSLLNLPAVTRESASDLHALRDKLNITLSALTRLNRSDSELWNDVLVHLVVQKLDPVTRKAWTLKAGDADVLPTYDDLARFLHARVRAIEEFAPDSLRKSGPKSTPRVSASTASSTASDRDLCPLCQAQHYLSKCPEFISKNAGQRRDVVKRHKRCSNCLSAYHASADCRSVNTCRSCQQKHHSMLHTSAERSSGSSTMATTDTVSISTTPAAEVTSLISSSDKRLRSRVLLATALIRVSVSSGRSAVVRALVDQGSEMTFVSERLVQLLKAKRVRAPISVSALGGISAGTFRHAVQIRVTPRHASNPTYDTTAVILPKTLTSCAPTDRCNLASYAHLKNLILADVDPTSSEPIEVLLGADLYCRRQVRPGDPTGALGPALSSAEIGLAKVFWLQRIQAENFPTEIHALANQQPLSSRSPLLALTPFLDRDGLVRVGGRLRKAPLAFSVRHPVLLSAHPLVELIIHNAHIRALHAGPQLTLNVLRRDFWILRARNAVKARIHKCIVCTRERAAIPTQIMGDLPAHRVTPTTRSFLHCGVDYAGPVLVRASAGRGIPSRKAYVAVFICLATKAVHLDLVSDYSTPAFIGAFSRFCARRGLPASMYSDNGTTFIGADKELTIAYKTALRDPNFLNQTAADHIEWHFIPPSAPHFGGLWESGVKSVKHHLRRVLSSHTLTFEETFEELTTVLCNIESCLNSRPLAALTDTLDDYECLTPGHFLVGSALTSPPEPSLLALNENRLSRWQLVRQLSERFWKLWQTDYLNTLQQRAKWREPTASVKVGQLVLIRNDSLPPCKWELGRVSQCHAGDDGFVRVVTIRTATSEYRRPIRKLCVLPVNIEPTRQ